jgi:ankyrin
MPANIFDAILANDIKTVIQLIELEQVDIHTLSPDGRTPLHIASYWGKFQIVKALIDLGADVNFPSRSNLWTPLHVACWGNQILVITRLILNGANVNCYDNFGYSPLHIAAHYGEPVIIDELIHHGALTYYQAKNGDTALHEAAYWLKMENYQCLLDLRSDPTIVNNYDGGLTAEQLLIRQQSKIKT